MWKYKESNGKRGNKNESVGNEERNKCEKEAEGGKR